MDYVEFEYWYMRFLNGHMDLDHEWNRDPKSITFDDLPLEIVCLITKNLSLYTRLSAVRYTSKTLRNVIEMQKMSVKSCALSGEKTESRLYIDGQYCNVKGNGILEWVMNNTEIETFEISRLTYNLGDVVKQISKSLTSKIRIKEIVHLDWCPEDFRSFLSLCDPQTLETIHIQYRERDDWQSIRLKAQRVKTVQKGIIMTRIKRCVNAPKMRQVTRNASIANIIFIQTILTH
uniref:FTH domain-containing protein n=1 Tax=Caenorhabditis tropicalis TaxID=1561998 RepID=A0A1I7U7L6_9PELO